MSQNSCLIVLGMHRSGTSALAGILSCLGIDFGEKLLPPVATENPKGFWEHEDIVALNEQILQSLGLTWDSIEPMADKWWEKSYLGEFSNALQAVLKRDFSDTPFWGIKDPRLCRLMPLWCKTIEGMECHTNCVLVLRHPGEVAQSLYARNALSEITSSLLWLEYMLDAERHSRGLPRVFVRYEDVLADWEKPLSPLIERLVDGGLRLKANYAEQIGAFLDPHLRHHNIARTTLRPPSEPFMMAQKLYENLPILLRDNRIEETFDTISAQLHQYRAKNAPWFEYLRNYKMNVQRKQEAMQRKIASLEAEIVRMRNSASWKTTMPLRLIQNTALSPSKALSEIALRMKLISEERFRNLTADKKTYIANPVSAPPLVRVATPPTPDSLQALALRCAAAPVISIVIPVFNQIRLTLECLLSIAKNVAREDVEVIVIDDSSADDTQATLIQIEGLRYARNEQNLGFTASCNRGASLAKGEFLVFLNNDTQIQPGWLDSLLEVFTEHSDAGIVGSKLLNPDGSLQEAGADLDAEAFATLRGQGANPSDEQYNSLKEVTYVSGASLMIRASLFRKIGGFDEVFSPAYSEDSDLAMRVRQIGYRVYYQPRSAVVHHLNATTGSLRLPVENLVLRNRKIFLARWGKALLGSGSTC
jgi:GT2 family glycosyltransferase